MAVNIKAREIALRVNNGTDAVAFDPSELNYFSEPISPTGLIRQQGSIVIDPVVSGTVETLDPDSNSAGRWNEGNTIECEVGAENLGPPVSHPSITGSKIINKPWYREGEAIEGLEIEVGCELTYLDNPISVDDRSGVDIAGAGLSIQQVINNHLIASGTTPLANFGPTLVTRRTWQALDRQSALATAGEIAFGADGGPWFIWNDENNQNRIVAYSDAVSSPKFTITESQLAEDLTRVRTQEYAKRFERVIARANLVEVDDCQFGTRVIAESYKTPKQFDSRYSDDTTLYLEYRETEDTSFSGSTFTRVVTQTGLFRVGAPSASTWTNYTNSIETTVETYNSDGLITKRITTKDAALLFSALPDEIFTVERTTITWTYGADKAITQILTEYEKPVIVTGIGIVLFDPATNPNREDAFLAKVGSDIEDYQKTNCGYDRTVIVRSENIAQGGSSYQILFTSTKEAGTTPVNAPPAPPTIPSPTLKETPIESTCALFPQTGTTPDKIRETEVTFRFVSSQSALDAACDWYASQLWQKATTYRVVIPYLDIVRAALLSPNPPFFAFDLQRDDGSVLRLLWDDAEFVYDFDETKVIVKAQKIATVVAGNPVLPFNFALEAESGSVTISSTGSTLSQEEIFTPDPGIVTISGDDMAMSLEPSQLEPNPGIVLISGDDSLLSSSLAFQPDPGGIILLGDDIVMSRENALVLTPGIVTISGNDSEFVTDSVLQPTSGIVTISGDDSEFAADSILQSTPGTVVISGENSTLTLDSGADADADNVVTKIKLVGTLTASEETAVRDQIAAFKTAGLWSSLEAYYGFAGGTAAAHAINWKNPGTYDITWNGPALTHDEEGVKGNGSGYGDTGLAPSDLPLNDVSFGCVVREFSNSGAVPMLLGALVSPTSVSHIFRQSSTGTLFGAVNGDASSSLTNAPEGVYLMTRDNASDITLFHNGSRTTSASNTVSSISETFYILARNSDGVAVLHGSHRLGSAFFFNKALSLVEEQNFEADEVAYQTAMGR